MGRRICFTFSTCSGSISTGYSWSDGTPLSHTNWGPGEPNNHDGREDCVEMVTNGNGSHSSWNDLNCDAHQDWICMIAKGKNPVLPPEPPSPVPGTVPTMHLDAQLFFFFAKAVSHSLSSQPLNVAVIPAGGRKTTSATTTMTRTPSTSPQL